MYDYTGNKTWKMLQKDSKNASAVSMIKDFFLGTISGFINLD